MSSTVSIRNLSASTDSETVRQAFETFGTITSVSISKDRSGVRSASVTFAGDRAGAMAVSAMDGAYIDGRRVEVSVE